MENFSHECTASYFNTDDGIWLVCETVGCDWRINMDYWPSARALFGMSLAHQRNPEAKNPKPVVVEMQ